MPHRKTLVLLAIPVSTLMASPVCAQSSVSINGYIDIGVFRDTSKKWNVGGMQPSNLAFSGSEDLGDGLAATFRLSTRFDPDTGATEGGGAKPFWHGESTVGLKGAFGSVQFGRRLDAQYNNEWPFDPWGNFNRNFSPAWDLWHYNFPSDPKANSGTADYGRLNNGIFYDSPSLKGFAIHLSGSPELRDGDANRAFGGTLNYDQGGYSAMIGREKNSEGNTDLFFGLKGSVSNISLMGAYDISKAGASTAKTTTLGATYNLDLTTLMAGWGQVSVDGVKPEKLVSLGASHALSKRSSIYAGFAHKTFISSSANTYGMGVAHSF